MTRKRDITRKKIIGKYVMNRYVLDLFGLASFILEYTMNTGEMHIKYRGIPKKIPNKDISEELLNSSKIEKQYESNRKNFKNIPESINE